MLPLSSGKEDRDVTAIAFLKERRANSTLHNPLCPPPNAEKNQDSLIVIVSVLLGGSVIVVFVLAGVTGSIFRSRKQTSRGSLALLDSAFPSPIHSCFAYD
jgi:hypothetical protein